MFGYPYASGFTEGISDFGAQQIYILIVIPKIRLVRELLCRFVHIDVIHAQNWPARDSRSDIRHTQLLIHESFSILEHTTWISRLKIVKSHLDLNEKSDGLKQSTTTSSMGITRVVWSYCTSRPWFSGFSCSCLSDCRTLPISFRNDGCISRLMYIFLKTSPAFFSFLALVSMGRLLCGSARATLTGRPPEFPSWAAPNRLTTFTWVLPWPILLKTSKIFSWSDFAMVSPAVISTCSCVPVTISICAHFPHPNTPTFWKARFVKFISRSHQVTQSDCASVYSTSKSCYRPGRWSTTVRKSNLQCLMSKWHQYLPPFVVLTGYVQSSLVV